MPLIWTIPNNYPQHAYGEYDRASSPDRFLFLKSRSLDDLPQATIRFRARVHWLRKFDSLAHSARIPLVSQLFAAVLSRVCPNDVQLFPAIVSAADAEFSDYSLVNATREVAAVDYSESSVVYFPGTDFVMKFNRLSHLPGVFDGVHIARERDYPSHLLISESLAGELLRMNATGLKFIRPEEVHP